VTARLPHKGACGNEKTVKATICDPKLRTLNRKAECGSQADTYYYNPWRAPGSAPVFDACGIAGGAPRPAGSWSAGVHYQNTTHARQGDMGSKVLRPAAGGSTTVWTAGELAEVSWGIRTNHGTPGEDLLILRAQPAGQEIDSSHFAAGGGYQYRLCPADAELTEACFQDTPLPFEGLSSLRWGGAGGKRLFFEGTYVSEGTVPAGSTWAMNPLPRVDATKYPDEMDAFPAPCYEPNPPKEGGYGGLCSGWYGPDNLEVVDQVRVPRALAAGEYALGFRWDCEESAQVWQNCASVTIKA
jgi:hypothetical protein